MSFIEKKAHRLAKELEKTKKGIKLLKTKGFLKDPLFYFGITSVILFGTISLGASYLVNSLDLPGDFSFSNSNPLAINQGLYLSSNKISLAQSPDFFLVQGTSLKGVCSPTVFSPQVLATLVGTDSEESRREIIEYVVESGDSLWSISLEFNVSIDTIVWANNIKSALISPGQKLLILPVSGVMHLVKEGDTIGNLAKDYKTDTEKIVAFNDLAGEGDIFTGEVLIIPDGKMTFASEIQPAETSVLSRLSTNNFYGKSHSFPYGQCTWWVAQKRAIPAWGHAKDWMNNAIASGFSVCKGRYCVPRVGAVIALSGSATYGHVGYVEEVRGDKIVFSEMNYIGWGRMNYRSLRIGSSSIKGYIY
ncbi:LysM peptidoglycan-binding domain-containing protein [Patescibacteria group bacterium]